MEQERNKKVWLISGVVVVLLAACSWGLVSHFSNLDETQVALSIPKDAPMEERFAAMEKFREQMRREDLTDEEREKLGDSMRRMWESEMQDRVNEYFEADPEERERILNRHIDDMEQWRKMMDERRKEEEQKARDEGKSDEEVEKEREQQRERWRDRMRSASREERKERSETRNPNEMAHRMAYFSAMRKQAEKRGGQLPGSGGGGGRGPGGGGPPRG